jgi:primary-amine oxidase
MLRRFGLFSASVLTVLLVCGGLRAQNTTSATDEMIENALRELRTSFESGNNGYTFDLNGRSFTLQRLQKGSKVLIKTHSARSGTSLQAINLYNEEVAVTTRAVRYAKEGVVLEAGLDCRLGVTTATLRQFISGFAEDARAFESFLAKAGKNPGKPPEVVTGKQPEVITGGDPGEKKPPVNVVKAAPIPFKIKPGSDDKEVEIAFPTQDGEPAETAWKIIWDMQSGEQAVAQGYKLRSGKSPLLFKVKKAYFRPGAKMDWVQVLEDAHPSEFYVPYFFQSTRFFDLRDVGGYVSLLAREGGARSRLMGKDRNVMAELRDRGIVYKHGALSRRGEEFVLWANFAAGNYTYLVEFCFHDDGTIAFKHSPTGYNYFSHFDEGSHMHNCLWRIGMKLTPVKAGKANNLVSLVSLPYDPKKLGGDGKLDIKPIANESFHDWNAKEFTRVRVTNPDFSVFPADATPRLPISYDMVAVAQGQARHYRFKDENFSHHDFWVTRSDCPEKMYVYLGDHFAKQTEQVPLQGSDGVVLWHQSSGLHVPRAEDGIVAGNSSSNGQALVYWTTVELRPRNLFNSTPLYKRER